MTIHVKNQIVCLKKSFAISLRKDKVKVSQVKISCVFSCNKNASTEPHNYPLNPVFSVNKNLVYFWHVIFLSWFSHNISQDMRFWKEDIKNVKTSFFFLTGSVITLSLSLLDITSLTGSVIALSLSLCWISPLLVPKLLHISTNQQSHRDISIWANFICDSFQEILPFYLFWHCYLLFINW